MMNNFSPKDIGKNYSIIADKYEENRSLIIGLDYVKYFLQLLTDKQDSTNANLILDIGCGNGIPLTKYLDSSGVKVIGLDISEKMIDKAKANVPNASFIQGDILTTRFDQKFDGIIAWDSLFHIPLTRQEEVIRKVLGLLKPNGVFLFTAGGKAGELVSEMFGKEFYYSSLSVEEYENILLTDNCQIIINEVDDPRSHGHRVICCKKIEI